MKCHTLRGQPWSPPPAAPDDSARAAGRVVFALAELQGLAAGDGPAHRAWPLQPRAPINARWDRGEPQPRPARRGGVEPRPGGMSFAGRR